MAGKASGSQAMISSSAPRIGYVPVDPSLKQPADYRRFSGYAKLRGLEFEEARWGETYDLVVLSCQADISLWKDYKHGKIVYDLIDSYLSIPYSNIKGLFRGIAKFAARQNRNLRVNYWAALRDMCRKADVVVCTTEMQRSSILPYCENVHIILDLHTEVVTTIKQHYTSEGAFKLVWEGLPTNIHQLEMIHDVLKKISMKYPIELHVVTDLEGRMFLGRYGRMNSMDVVQRIFKEAKVHAWDKETFSTIITECDAAIIPINLSDNLLAGKPENKLLLLWRLGMPVVASATTAYTRAMNDAGISLICKDNNDWVDKLERIIVDQELRCTAGRRGYKYASEHFGERQIVERWDRAFHSIGFDFSTGHESGIKQQNE
jgi:glycosyltransferase involved in cell wall biosynthesis